MKPRGRPPTGRPRKIAKNVCMNEEDWKILDKIFPGNTSRALRIVVRHYEKSNHPDPPDWHTEGD